MISIVALIFANFSKMFSAYFLKLFQEMKTIRIAVIFFNYISNQLIATVNMFVIRIIFIVITFTYTEKWVYMCAWVFLCRIIARVLEKMAVFYAMFTEHCKNAYSQTLNRHNLNNTTDNMTWHNNNHINSTLNCNNYINI